MKKILSVILVLSFLLFAFAVPTIAEDEMPEPFKENTLNYISPAGGAYIITTLMKPGIFKFNCGWNNSKAFAATPVAYWIGVYDCYDDPDTLWFNEQHYVWVESDVIAEEDSKMLKLSFETLNLISGREYKINFFVRDFLDTDGVAPDETTNTFEYELHFIAP